MKVYLLYGITVAKIGCLIKSVELFCLWTFTCVLLLKTASYWMFCTCHLTDLSWDEWQMLPHRVSLIVLYLACMLSNVLRRIARFTLSAQT